jgi:hypothetical protein
MYLASLGSLEKATAMKRLEGLEVDSVKVLLIRGGK